jgi:hypothetical protein
MDFLKINSMANIDVYVGNTGTENWKHANFSLSWNSVRVASLEGEILYFKHNKTGLFGFSSNQRKDSFAVRNL